MNSFDIKDVRIFVKICDIDPFVLQIPSGLKEDQYLDCVQQHFNNRYKNNKNNPPPIILSTIINLKNGDKILFYNRLLYCSEKVSIQEGQSIFHEIDDDNENVDSSSNEDDGSSPEFIGLNKLLLKLTNVTADDEMHSVFLFTFRSFTEPWEVLRKLIERWEMPQFEGSIFNESFSESEIVDIRHKILEFLQKWINLSPWDFDSKMINLMTEFCSWMTKEDDKNSANSLLESINKKDRRYPWETQSPGFQKPRKVSTATFQDVTEQELAQQLTLIDHSLFCKIKFWELPDLAWTKESLRYKAPNLMAFINHFNRISSWISYIILKPDDKKERKRKLRKLVGVMNELKKIHSINMVMAIVSAISSASVYRLTVVQDEIKNNKNLENFLSLSNVDNNHKAIREELSVMEVPGCPQISIYLKDIFFCETGNSTKNQNQVNWSKFIKIHQIIRKIIHFQQTSYKIDPIPSIQSMILKETPPSEDELYEMSLKIEARG